MGSDRPGVVGTGRVSWLRGGAETQPDDIPGLAGIESGTRCRQEYLCGQAHQGNVKIDRSCGRHGRARISRTTFIAKGSRAANLGRDDRGKPKSAVGEKA